jgi:polyhydroxyalkanoate synthesis regulator phasin
MAFSQLSWIIEKAAELLEDKVKEGPISERDVEIAFEIFARSRLEQIAQDLGPAREAEAKDYILMKLRERARQLNAQHWGKE